MSLSYISLWYTGVWISVSLDHCVYSHWMNIYKYQFTTRKLIVAECLRLCRVPEHRHSAKRSFAECPRNRTRQTPGTRHAQPLPSSSRRQRRGTRHYLSLPSAAGTALGKGGARAQHARPLCAFLTAGWRTLALPSATRLALGKDLTSPSACSQHSAKTVSLGKEFLFFYIQTFLFSTQIWKVNP